MGYWHLDTGILFVCLPNVTVRGKGAIANSDIYSEQNKCWYPINSINLPVLREYIEEDASIVEF